MKQIEELAFGLDYRDSTHVDLMSSRILQTKSKVNELVYAFNELIMKCEMSNKDRLTVEKALLCIIKERDEKIEALKRQLKEIQMNEGE